MLEMNPNQNFKLSDGTEVSVLFYKNFRHVEILVIDPCSLKEHVVVVSASNLRSGKVKNRFAAGKRRGYLGIGKYRATSRHCKKTPAYAKWTNMLDRCYGPIAGGDLDNTRPTVCDAWLNFQNFAEWFYGQTGWQFKDMQLDKDFRSVNGIKHYSPETCCLMAGRINRMFNGRTVMRRAKSASNIRRCHDQKLYRRLLLREQKILLIQQIKGSVAAAGV